MSREHLSDYCIEELEMLYVELDAVDDAMAGAYFVCEYHDLNLRRAELLGEIKRMERSE